MGPQLISRLLALNETQESILTLVFEFADDEGMLLVDLNDLRTTLEYLGSHGKDLGVGYSVSKASVNAILRRLLMLEREGADQFFGEPALQLEDFMQTSRDGRGTINVLLDKIEQVVRLIRSKGVGIYFVTQSPGDIPDSVLSQLGNRIQHALRAYTPREQKVVKVAAQSFRENPDLDTFTTITQMGVGEALVSTLQDKGVPAPVQTGTGTPTPLTYGQGHGG